MTGRMTGGSGRAKGGWGVGLGVGVWVGFGVGVWVGVGVGVYVGVWVGVAVGWVVLVGRAVEDGVASSCAACGAVVTAHRLTTVTNARMAIKASPSDR